MNVVDRSRGRTRLLKVDYAIGRDVEPRPVERGAVGALLDVERVARDGGAGDIVVPIQSARSAGAGDAGNRQLRGIYLNRGDHANDRERYVRPRIAPAR